MISALSLLQRFAPRRTILFPATLALLGAPILVLLWALAPPPAGSAAGAPTAHPFSTITWQPTAYVGVANGDLAPAVHPTDPLRALLGGPTPIRYTTDGGASWQSAGGLGGLNPGVPAWLPGGNGQSALQVSLSQVSPRTNLTPGPTGNALNFARSTDSGAHWSVSTTLTIPGIAENLPYLWADSNPSSPYYGRMYLTLTMLDSARTGSFDTVGFLFSTDQGTTWSTPVGLVDPTEFAQGTNYNAFATAAIQPSGAVVVAWHRGACCQTITNVPNKVMWSRSTDGGVTFPVSGTIATVPVSQSLQYNSYSPGGYFRWTPAPNIAADPVDGTLYAAWVAYRQPNTPESAGIYLSRSTDNGTSWSAPVEVGSNGPYIFQYVPWVQVSPDHVVHVTFQAATSVVDVIAHFYIQSIDRGATWSTPFSLSLNGHINGALQGDYQATSLGGYNGSQGTILTSWEDEQGSGVRIGTFPLGIASTPSPTATATATCIAAGTPGPWAVRANYPQMLTDIAVASDGPAVYAFGGRNASGRHSQAYKYNYATDSWTAIASFPYDAIAEAEAEYGHNGKIYVIWWNGTYIYDIATNSWSLGAPPPQSELSFGHAYWNGKIYVIGGYVTDAINAVYAYDIATNSWSTLAPLPQAEGLMAAAAINGKIYVANGQTAGLGETNNLYIYDIATDSWTQGPSSPHASSGPGSAAIGGKLYMIGGMVNGYTSNTYLYDPISNSWSQGSSLNVARGGGNAAAINTPGGLTTIVVGGAGGNFWTNSVEASTAPLVPCTTVTVTPVATATTCPSGGSWIERAPYPISVSGNAVASQGVNVYSFGGIANNSAITSAYKYTPATNSWTAIAPLPAPRAWFSAASDGTYVYLLGGVDQNFSTTATLWRYDPANNTYNTGLPPYTIPTYFHASVYLNGKIYRIAGRAIGTDYHVEVYDIAANSWSMAADYPFANHSLMAVALGGYIYAGGGNASPDKTYRYDPNTDTWDDSAIADLPVGRSAAASGAYNGRWLLAGGDVNFAISNSVIAWDPALNTWNNLPNMLQARDYLGGTTAGQSFYAVAGNSGPGAPTNDNQQYTETTCATPSPTLIASSTPTTAYTASSTTVPPTITSTAITPSNTVPVPTSTIVPPTPTACTVSFSDVPPGSAFYSYIRCLACRGIVSGYADGTFRPGNNITRGQISKVVSNAANLQDPVPSDQQTYQDVPHSNTFWLWIERLTMHHAMSGYNCGGLNEPCIPPNNRPYFRWANNATRAQLSKIVANAYGGYPPPGGQTFEDVPPTNPFYQWIEQLAEAGVIGGYQCGSEGEPCVPPGNRPYFRPYNNVTRGQASKIVANTFFPGCQTPDRNQWLK